MEAESLLKQKKFVEAVAVYEKVKSPSGKDFAALRCSTPGKRPPS